MSVKIRLRRAGAKNKPFYHIVVSDSRAPRDGKYIERIGFYEPRNKKNGRKLDIEKLEKWVKRGALITPRVKSLMKTIKTP